MTKACAFVILALLAGCYTPDDSHVRVIDGDTITWNGKTIRINGIDAPEHGQTCGTWTCGAEATEKLAGFVADKKLACVTHSQDGYGRDIATCWADGQDIGAQMVEAGAAWAFLKYSDTYAPQQARAQRDKRGIWSGKTAYETPWEFRAKRWESSAQIAPEGCPIKGNITENGKIYHPPWSPWYAKTRIDTARGERWFCDEAEAQAAGWRAARWR